MLLKSRTSLRNVATIVAQSRTTLSGYFLTIILLSSIAALPSVNRAYPATATIDLSIQHQTIEGFGGGLLFDVHPYGRANKDELFDSIFNSARVNLIRLENRFEHDTTNSIDIAMMKEIQEKWPHVKVFISAWSPPGYLKSNDTTAGKSGSGAATLKKNADSSFMYAEYGDWWQRSMRFYDSAGVNIDWLSIQNEPNWPADWRGCYLSTLEDSTHASYGKALDAVYSHIQKLDKPVKLIGPDITGIGENNLEKYLQSPEVDPAQLSAVCHHYYNGADSATMKKILKLFPQGRLLYQTEMLYNDGNVWPLGSTRKWWFDHAQLIQSALVDEGVNMYNLFALTYKHLSTHCFFSLDDENGGSEFTTRPIYFAFKQFSRSIHRGWKRIEATVDEKGIKMSAFASPSEDSLAVIIISGNLTPTSLSLTLPQLFLTASVNGEIYQTTESLAQRGEIDKKYHFEGTFTPNKQLDIAARSITTVDIRKNGSAIDQFERTLAGSSRHSIDGCIRRINGQLSIKSQIPQHIPFSITLTDLSGRTAVYYSSKGTGAPEWHPLNKHVVSGTYLVTLRVLNKPTKSRLIVID